MGGHKPALSPSLSDPMDPLPIYALKAGKLSTGLSRFMLPWTKHGAGLGSTVPVQLQQLLF